MCLWYQIKGTVDTRYEYMLHATITSQHIFLKIFRFFYVLQIGWIQSQFPTFQCKEPNHLYLDLSKKKIQ